MDRSQSTSNASNSSSTTTTTVVAENQAPSETRQRTLRLTLQSAAKPSIKWSEDTIDNEHMGKKSSKSK